MRSSAWCCVFILFLLIAWATCGGWAEVADDASTPAAEQSTAIGLDASQEPPAHDDRAEAEIEVEVVGRHEWPARVETVTAEQVEAMVNTPFLGDVLERMSGADTLTGCPMGAPLITIRGNNSEWSEILLEGIPMSPIGRPYILNYVPMSAVDTVRLLKGPVPPKYPGTTIAGLVLMDMKTGDQYPGTKVKATVGTYGQRIVDVNVGGGNPERNYFLSLTRHEMTGWQPHSDMRFNFLSAKIALAPDDRSKLTLVGAHLFGEKDGPRPLGPNPADKWAAEWSDVSQPKASLTYERKLSDRSDMMIRLVPYWFSGTQLWSQWFTDHSELRFMPWDYDLLRTEFQGNIKATPDRIWTWGGSWQKDVYSYAGPMKTSFWDNIPASQWKEYTKRARAVYVQHSLPTKEDGILTLGGRYDAEEPGQSILSPFASWHIHLTPNTRLRLSGTRSRRFPKLMELYGQGMWVGNPGLEPEMGWTYQADLSRTFGDTSLDVSVFNSSLESLIVADEHNVFDNLGEARVWGLESACQRTWQKGSLWCNYTYLDAEDATTGDPLIVAFRTAYPKHSAKLGITIQESGGGEHAVEVLAYGRRHTDANQPVYVGEPWNVTVPTSMPGFVWVNYKYSWPLRDRGKFTLAVENVFDAEAQDLLFYPRPGRWVSGSMSWHFR